MPPHRGPRPGRHASASRFGSSALVTLRSHADRLDVTAHASRFTREVALCLAAVLLVGMGAAGARPTVAEPVASAAPRAVTTLPEAPADPARTTGLAGRTPALALPAPRKSPVLKPAPAPRPPARARKVERWLPSGTGMWLHDWKRSERGSAPHVVGKARSSGLTHLYVQTGSTRKGWIGDEVLSELLPATAGTDLKVIAWDFPKLIDPEADARRMARAATFGRKGMPRVAAVAPDVETAAEGTRLSKRNVHRYYRELRKRLPGHIAILATVPWPSEKRTGWYPYDDTATYADAFVPMAYWYNRDPAVVTATSMKWLSRFGKPVMPVGQGYDGRIDAPYLPEDPDLAGSVTRFIDTARKHKARSISLWSWQTTEPAPWSSLVKAAGTIGPDAARPAAAQPEKKKALTPQERAEQTAKSRAPGRTRDRRAGSGSRG